MKRPNLGRISIPVVAGVLLFVVNNVLLMRGLAPLPGGTTLAVTDMAVVALLVLGTLAFDAIVAIWRYRWSGLFVGVLPFVLWVMSTRRAPFDLATTLAALMPACAGLGLGVLAHGVLRRRSGVPAA